MENQESTGSCLCGAVKFTIKELNPKMSNCHCTMCQKASASSFMTWAHGKLNQFEWKGGETNITGYKSSENTTRSFCSTCGSHLPIIDEKGGTVYIPAGLLDPPVKGEIAMHMFIRSKPEWHKIGDNAPQHETYPK